MRRLHGVMWCLDWATRRLPGVTRRLTGVAWYVGTWVAMRWHGATRLHGVMWWLDGATKRLDGVTRWLHGVTGWLHGVTGWLHGVTGWLHGITRWLGIVKCSVCTCKIRHVLTCYEIYHTHSKYTVPY
ncbi:hypothetical protein OIU78_026344 [Salix suchowensis]|nr:hypothetical protein OIU78_026344 [Salix suchowensis]